MSFTFNDTALFLLVGTTRSGNSDCLIIYLGETWSLPKKRDAMHYMHLCNAHLVCLKQLPWPFRIEHYASVSELSISPISIFFRFRFRLRGRFDVTKYLCSHKDLSLSYSWKYLCTFQVHLRSFLPYNFFLEFPSFLLSNTYNDVNWARVFYLG